MAKLLDMPDEILLKIIAWIPYNRAAGSHKALCLVNKHLRSIMDESSLPLTIAQNQFPELYTLRLATKENTVTGLSSKKRTRAVRKHNLRYLRTTWKRARAYASWTRVLQARGMSESVCEAGLAMLFEMRKRTMALFRAKSRICTERVPMCYYMLVELRLIRTLPIPTLLLQAYTVRCLSRALRSFSSHMLSEWWADDSDVPMATKAFLLELALESSVTGLILHTRDSLIDSDNPHSNTGAPSSAKVNSCLEKMIPKLIFIAKSWYTIFKSEYPHAVANPVLSSSFPLILALHIRLSRLDDAQYYVWQRHLSSRSMTVDEALASRRVTVQDVSQQIEDIFTHTTKGKGMLAKVNLYEDGHTIHRVIKECERLDQGELYKELQAECDLYGVHKWLFA